MQAIPGVSYPKISFVTVSVKLNSFASTDFVVGIQLYNDWEKYMTQWRNDQIGMVSQDQFSKAFVVTPKALKSTIVSSGYFAY